MKKLIITMVFAFAVLFSNAQFKVYQSGNVAVGGISFTPNSPLTIGSGTNPLGNSLYKVYINSSSTANNSVALYVQATAAGSGSRSYSIIGKDSSDNYSNSYGYGVYGQAYKTVATSTLGRHYGVYGYAGNATSGFNYGVYGIISGTPNGAGIYGTTDTNGDTLVPGKYAGYFKGSFRVANATAEKFGISSWTIYSDSRLKTNVTPFQDGLNVIRKINPVNYNFNGKGGLPKGTPFIGVIAQQVQQVAPYCIGKSRIVLSPSESQNFSNDIAETVNDSGGTKNIVNVLNFSQDGLFYAMLNSIKQLDSTVTALQAQMNASKSSQRTNNNSGQGNNETTLQVELANKDNIILYQNQPNPFDGSTEIRYFIPENMKESAYVVFYDMYGKEVNKLEIKEKGFGKIEAKTENLATGIYSYSMIVNDKTIDTKKMMKNK